MSSSDNERTNELVGGPASNGQRRMGQAIAAGFFVAVVVAMAGWLYLLSELLVVIYDWLFG
jgi:hypothetical protein